MPLTARQRFEKKFYITPGCWIWTAATSKGYGTVRFDGRMQKAHRVSLALYAATAPDHLVVCHRCDNPRCVNPDHLFIGSIADNNNDKVAKGRQSRTITNGGAKLPQRIVDEIRLDRKAGFSIRVIAKKFGIAHSHVWNIANGKKRIIDFGF